MACPFSFSFSGVAFSKASEPNLEKKPRFLAGWACCLSSLRPTSSKLSSGVEKSRLKRCSLKTDCRGVRGNLAESRLWRGAKVNSPAVGDTGLFADMS